MVIIRLSSIFSRQAWRSDLNGEFPSACGDWAIKDGCTRVAATKDECTRSKDIVSQNSVIFQTSDDFWLNEAILECIDGISGGKLMKPVRTQNKNLSG